MCFGADYRTPQLPSDRPCAASGAYWCVAVKGLSAYAKFAGEGRFLFTGCHTGAKLCDTLRGQGRLPALVHARPLRQCDALALTLTDKGPLKLRKRASRATAEELMRLLDAGKIVYPRPPRTQARTLPAARRT